jgi:hypothetical protein
VEAPVSTQLDVSRQSHNAGLSCIGFKPITGSSTLKGFADLHIGLWHLRIFGCACHAKGDKRWVQLPARPQLDKEGHAVRDDAGKVRYYPAISFDDDETRRRFSDAAIAALDSYTNGSWREGER